MPGSSSPASHPLSKERQIQAAMELYIEQLENGMPLPKKLFLEQNAEIADELESQLETLDFLHASTPDLAVDSEADEFNNTVAIGDFRLIRPIGRGGMGIVYEAVQLSLNRRVAVKVLPFAATMDTKQRKRFHNEARAAATLDHPHIVPIYFVGQDRGVHFYAMQLIEGQSLAEVVQSLRHARIAGQTYQIASLLSTDTNSSGSDSVRTNASTSTARQHKQIAELGIQAAEALHHAHQQGVIHRDVKPGNLLLDQNGKLWVTDFGLARMETNDTLTAHGDIVGTAAYMSPEQLTGSHLADARSDVFSLAATLYKLLMLKPPFAKKATERALGDALPQLRRFDPTIPVDLETILQKALAHDSVDRYQSAQALADDLRRFVTGHPIEARRPSLLDHFAKWTRRHQKLVAVGVLSVLALCGALAASAMLVWQANQNTEAALEQSRLNEDRVSELLYLADMQLAFQAWDSRRPEQARESLDRHIPANASEERRGFEWHLLDNLIQQPRPTLVGSHAGGANQAAVFPDGNRLATVGQDHQLRIWDMQQGRLLRAIDMGTSSVEPLFSVAVAPDGKTVATGSDVVQLWDVESGQRIREVRKFEANVQSLAFSPNGEYLATGTRYDRICVFDRQGQLVGEAMDESRHNTLRFAADNRTLLVPCRFTEEDGDRVGFIRAWTADLATVHRDYLFEDHSAYYFADIAADGSYVAAGVQSPAHPVKLVALETGDALLELSHRREGVASLAVSPHGTTVLAAYADGGIGWWRIERLADGTLRLADRPGVFHAHHAEVNHACFISDTEIITCGADGAVNRWTLPSDRSRWVELPIAESTIGMRLCPFPDHQLFAWLGSTTMKIIDRQGTVISSWDAYGGAVGISPDQATVAVSGPDLKSIQLRDTLTGEVKRTIPGAEYEISSVAFAGDGSHLAIVDKEGNLRVWDLVHNIEVGQVSVDGEFDGDTYHVGYSLDSQTIVCGGQFGKVVLLDSLTLETIREVPTADLNGMRLDHQGRRLIGFGSNGEIPIWQFPSLQLLGKLHGHTVSASDGGIIGDDLLISCSADKTMRLWSLQHMREFGVVIRTENAIGEGGVSADGTVIWYRTEDAIGIFSLHE